MLTLYGRKTSDSVQKALWALGETDQPFEHIPLGGAYGGLDDPAYADIRSVRTEGPRKRIRQVRVSRPSPPDDRANPRLGARDSEAFGQIPSGAATSVENDAGRFVLD